MTGRPSPGDVRSAIVVLVSIAGAPVTDELKAELTEPENAALATVVQAIRGGRPSASELLQTPGALLYRTDLAELGLRRRAIDVVFALCPVVQLPGHSRPMARSEDVLALLDRFTYGNDQVRPSRSTIQPVDGRA